MATNHVLKWLIRRLYIHIYNDLMWIWQLLTQLHLAINTQNSRSKWWWVCLSESVSYASLATVASHYITHYISHYILQMFAHLLALHQYWFQILLIAHCNEFSLAKKINWKLNAMWKGEEREREERRVSHSLHMRNGIFNCGS